MDGSAKLMCRLLNVDGEEEEEEDKVEVEEEEYEELF